MERKIQGKDRKRPVRRKRLQEYDWARPEGHLQGNLIKLYVSNWDLFADSLTDVFYDLLFLCLALAGVHPALDLTTWLCCVMGLILLKRNRIFWCLMDPLWSFQYWHSLWKKLFYSPFFYGTISDSIQTNSRKPLYLFSLFSLRKNCSWNRMWKKENPLCHFPLFAYGWEQPA